MKNVKKTCDQIVKELRKCGMRITKTAGEPIYQIIPCKDFNRMAKADSGNWMNISDSQCDEFVEIVEKHGCRLGDTGGHPRNCSFILFQEEGDIDTAASFCFWGNPYHI